MYFMFSAGGNAFDNLIGLVFSSVPMLHSSMSDLKGSIFGFLATSFESNKSSNGTKLKVTHKVRVPFTVGDYVDEVECDVLPLEVCGLLLGHPWQYDRNVTHAGRANIYSFMHGGKQ